MTKKQELELLIFKKLKYKQAPYRIFPRIDRYGDIKNRLYANLNRAINIAIDEGERIIKAYRKLDFYIEEIAFGKKRNFQISNQKRNLTVDILMKKQRKV